jgi:large subunit ribosomal protein L25
MLDMELAGKTSKVLLRDVQMHPFKQLVLHIDFQRVDAKTKLHMKVPLHYSGEEESPAVKLDHCLVNHVDDRTRHLLPAGRPARVHRSGPERPEEGRHAAPQDVKLPKGVTAVTRGKEQPGAGVGGGPGWSRSRGRRPPMQPCRRQAGPRLQGPGRQGTRKK